MIIRLPDLDDLLEIARAVDGVEDERELRERVHPERGARAILRARRAKALQGEYGELASLSAALCLAIADSGFIDDADTNLLIGYFAMKLTVNRTGLAWIPRGDDWAVLRRIRDGYSEVTHQRLGSWVGDHLGKPVEVDLPPDVHVHFSARLWNLSDEDEAQLTIVANAVAKELARFSEAIPDFKVRPLDPRFPTWPTTAGNEVQGIEERLMLADGLISFGVGGGSFGAGEDRDFEEAVAVPILHLQPEELDMSPRDRSWLKRVGARYAEYPSSCPPKHTEAIVRGIVSTWLQKEFRRLCDAKLHERINLARARPLYEMLKAARENMPTTVWRRNLGDHWMTEARADDLLSDLRRFLRAALSEQLDLCGACGVPHTIDLPPTPPFNPDQIELPLLVAVFDTMREIIPAEKATADELVDVMELAESKFGPGRWSKALGKRATLVALLREVRANAKRR